jgi:hypothetical protein
METENAGKGVKVQALATMAAARAERGTSIATAGSTCLDNRQAGNIGSPACEKFIWSASDARASHSTGAKGRANQEYR